MTATPDYLAMYYFTAEQGVFGEAALQYAEDADGAEADVKISEIIWRDGDASENVLPLLTFCVLMLSDGRTIVGQHLGESGQDARAGRIGAQKDAMAKAAA